MVINQTAIIVLVCEPLPVGQEISPYTDCSLLDMSIEARLFIVVQECAILTGIKARLATVLLTVMIASFGLLANGPMLVANPSSHFNWTESALNLALIGTAWVVADSLVQS